MAPLQFVPFSSAVDAAFWHVLSQRKLEVYKLDDAARPLQGYYATGGPPELPPRLCLDAHAFVDHDDDGAAGIPASSFRARGTLLNANTVEAFKAFDKQVRRPACSLARAA